MLDPPPRPPRSAAAPVRPDEVTSSRLRLWLDTTYVDGDGVEDRPPWERGSLLGWQDKPGAFSRRRFGVCEPTVLNGTPVASWQSIRSRPPAWQRDVQQLVFTCH